jgi:nucleotidyltransferase/DNA polymerase involved in DNA repair
LKLNFAAVIVRAMSPPENKTSPLAGPVNSLWGVGGERAAQLARLGIVTIEDLLLHRRGVTKTAGISAKSLN